MVGVSAVNVEEVKVARGIEAMECWQPGQRVREDESVAGGKRGGDSPPR